MDQVTQPTRNHEIALKMLRLLHNRLEEARQRFEQRTSDAIKGGDGTSAAMVPKPAQFTPWGAWHYTVDFAQRSVLFWDTLRERGMSSSSATRAGTQARAAFRL